MTHDESTAEVDVQPDARFQWKWVGASLALYVVFYFLPLMLIPGGLLSGSPSAAWSVYVIGIWGTAGIFILAAIPAYFSRGVTVWEPVVSAVFLVLLMLVAASLKYNSLIVDSVPQEAEFAIMLFVVFALSYFGAWWGERHQMLRHLAEHPEEGIVVEEASDAEDSA